MEKQLNRRKGPDFCTKMISYTAMMGWTLLLTTLIVFHIARPDKAGDRQFKTGGNLGWDVNSAKYILYLCIAGVIFSIMGIIINSLRKRRRKDFIHVNLIVLGIVSIAGIIGYFMKF